MTALRAALRLEQLRTESVAQGAKGELGGGDLADRLLAHHRLLVLVEAKHVLYVGGRATNEDDLNGSEYFLGLGSFG